MLEMELYPSECDFYVPIQQGGDGYHHLRDAPVKAVYGPPRDLGI